MSFSILETTLSLAVADNGTFTVSYPSGKDAGDFYAAHGHRMTVDGNVHEYPADFDVTLGTASVTITNKTGGSFASGAVVKVQLEEQGERQYRTTKARNAAGVRDLVASAVKGSTILINLGAPIAADADGIATAQAVAAAGDATIDGARASSGVATLDKPRNVTAVSSDVGDTTQTLTVTGTDVYGETVVEEVSLNGTTTVAGKKAFKTVTQVAVDAALAGNLSVGFGDVLGLPVFLPNAGMVLKELEGGAAATAGTLVAGDLTAGGPTATTGDVRGTYDPSTACDGSAVFQLIAFLPDPGYIGVAQYAG